MVIARELNNRGSHTNRARVQVGRGAIEFAVCHIVVAAAGGYTFRPDVDNCGRPRTSTDARMFLSVDIFNLEVLIHIQSAVLHIDKVLRERELALAVLIRLLMLFEFFDFAGHVKLDLNHGDQALIIWARHQLKQSQFIDSRHW